MKNYFSILILCFSLSVYADSTISQFRDVKQNQDAETSTAIKDSGAPQEALPMAPFIGPKKKEVIKALRHYKKGQFKDITLGCYEPKFVIHFSGGKYKLSPLVLDETKARQSAQEKQAEGYYVPEMVWQHLAPGTPLFEESDIPSLIRKLKSWPGWVDVQCPNP